MSKKFITLSTVVFLLVASFAGCTGKDTEKETASKTSDEQTQQGDDKGSITDTKGQKKEGFSEAPMLQEMVKAGALPEVEERLPVKEDIMIERVAEEIGQHGGDWRFPWLGKRDKWDAGYITEEALFRFGRDGESIEPNVAKSYEVNADSTEYIIHLREGMKWSDGEPFSADDVLFYWEHMLLKETFGKSLYNCYFSVNPDNTEEIVQAEVTKIDDYTVKITHKYPHPLFLERVAIDNKWFFAPAHFYKTILPEFIGEEKALEKAKEYGFEDLAAFGKWTGYYYWVYPQRPTLRAWIATNDADEQKFIMERNPYYWKTDAEGNQLPYLDRLVFDKYESADQFLLQALAGKVDITHFDFKEIEVLKENETKGNYRLLEWVNTYWGNSMIELNQTAKDDNVRALFQDIRFREALSICVDREELAAIATNGFSAPWQASVPKGLPNYIEGWSEKWTEYDIVKAEKLLDDIGMKWDANHKWRTHADGSEFTLTFHIKGDADTTLKGDKELLQKYYQAIGLKVNYKFTDDAYYQELKQGNEIEATFSDTGLVNVAIRPDNVVPMRLKDVWDGQYGLWNTSKGEEGIKPEGDIALLLEYYNKLAASVTKADVNKWSDEIIKLHEKNIWLIGYLKPTAIVCLVNNDMRNVPAGIIGADEFRSWGHARPMQFFKVQQ